MMLHNQIDGLFFALERRAAFAEPGWPWMETDDEWGFKVVMAGDSTMRVGALCVVWRYYYKMRLFVVW